MKNIEKYQSLLASGEVDALLLTSEYNRLYAAQYGVAEGVAAKGDDDAVGLAKRLRHCWNPFCKRPTTH